MTYSTLCVLNAAEDTLRSMKVPQNHPRMAEVYKEQGKSS